MKKRGFTMTELMFSIVIIAIVMAFLIKLLIDINYDKINELYATPNNVNRAEIIKTIQNDFKTTELVNVTSSGNSIVLLNGTSSATIGINTSSNYITYTSISFKKYKWKVLSNNSETYIDSSFIISCKKIDSSRSLITINIPIIINKSKSPIIENGKTIYRDSKMDDITLTFFSTKYTGVCEQL